jgi:hypothetical protein
MAHKTNRIHRSSSHAPTARMRAPRIVRPWRWRQCRPVTVRIGVVRQVSWSPHS